MALSVNAQEINKEETRTKIVVVETGLNLTKEVEPYMCLGSSISLVDGNPFFDESGHGTSVVSLIVKSLDPKLQCIVIVKYTKLGVIDGQVFKNVAEGIKYATKIKAKFLNLSLGGYSPFLDEYKALKEAIAAGIKISVAAGNDNIDLNKNCIYFPACYKFPKESFHVVGSPNYDPEQHLYWKNSNHGKKVTHFENGIHTGIPPLTGTSMSTATHTGKWASGKVK